MSAPPRWPPPPLRCAARVGWKNFLLFDYPSSAARPTLTCGAAHGGLAATLLWHVTALGTVLIHDWNRQSEHCLLPETEVSDAGVLLFAGGECEVSLEGTRGGPGGCDSRGTNGCRGACTARHGGQRSAGQSQDRVQVTGSLQNGVFGNCLYCPLAGSAISTYNPGNDVHGSAVRDPVS